MIKKNGKVILVTGATGHQGGAVLDSLLRNGWSVKAMTRKSSGNTIRSLEQKGAEVVNGDLFDKASLDKVLTGVYGVFTSYDFYGEGNRR